MVAFATIFWECASKNLTWLHLCECMVCAAPKRLLLHKACCQPQHIVAGEIFHWSREVRRFQREHFSRAWFTPVSHRTRSRGSAEAARMQSGSSVRPLCFHSPRPHERNVGFGFQTKVKDRFLNQRRWTCWYSCRENMQVLSATASLVLLFFLFRFVIFAVYLTLHYGGFPYFFNIIIIWFLSVC